MSSERKIPINDLIEKQPDVSGFGNLDLKKHLSKHTGQ